MENKGKILLQKYDVGKLLGQGNLETGQIVAVKVIDKEKILKVGMMDQIKREICAMRVVKHPNIVQLHEVLATKTKIYLVMEYIKGGELFNKIAKGKLKEDIARNYFQQLISAVDICHSRGVYHRDLKLENLILDENGSLKVTDFGLSTLVESSQENMLLHTTCGTPAYVAPEVVSRKGYDGAKADIWSCGIILYVILAGYLPFSDSNLMEMYKKMWKAEYKCPSWFSPEVRRLLSRILHPNPSKRISMEKITENPWFRKRFSYNKIKSDTEANEPAPLENAYASSTIIEFTKTTTLNAFDIISLSTGFDLSGLFAQNDENKVIQFTSTYPASFITSKLEDIAKHMKMKVSKNDKGLKLEGLGGRKGTLCIDVDIYEFTPSFHLVEVKKSIGDTLEYKKIMELDIKPALKDIVCTWPGEHQRL